MTICEGCGLEFDPVSARQRFHSDVCRTRTWRRGGAPQKMNDETLHGANRERVRAVAAGFEGSTDLDEAVLEAATSLAGQVDRDPANSMIWARYQSSLRELQAAVLASQDRGARSRQLSDDMSDRALIAERDHSHYGGSFDEGGGGYFWTGGDRKDRFAPFVESALAGRHPSWMRLWERNLWDVYLLPDDPDTCQIVVGSLPVCEVALADVGLNSHGQA